MSEQVKRYVTTCDCMSEAAWGDYVRLSDYEALHAEAEALRAENGRKQQTIDGMNDEHWKLVQAHAAQAKEMEAARGLLERVTRNVPQLYGHPGLLSEIGAFLTATPAPEVLAEQGERQEPVFMWHKGATEDESEIVDVDCACPCCVPLYTTPQPGRDVRALVEAGNPLSNAAYNLAQKSGHALTEFDCELLSELRKRWDAALSAHRQAQQGDSHDI